MARTIPSIATGIANTPALERFTASQPIVAGDSVTNVGRWASVGLAANLAYAVDACGPAVTVSWQDGQVSGTYTAGGRIDLRIPAIGPVAGASILGNLRLRVWGNSATTTGTVTLETASAGSVVVALAPTFTRYPSPLAPQILNVAADIVDGGDAGFYVDAWITLDAIVTSIESITLDWCEYGFDGTGTGYPGAGALPAGAVGNFVPADTAELATDSALSADLLFDRLQQWPEQFGRRRVKLAWAGAEPAGAVTAANYRHMPPVRIRAAAPVVPRPVGQPELWTIAAYCVPNSAGTSRVRVGFGDGTPHGFTQLAALPIPDTAYPTPGWYMLTFDATPIRQLGAPQSFAGLLELVVISDGAAPIGGDGESYYVDGRQTGIPSASIEFRCYSVIVWGP